MADTPTRPAESAQLDRSVAQRTVIAIVSRATGVREDKITPDTDLVFDLGVAGDDAGEILLELIKSYPIDFSGIDLSLWFGSEGLKLWEGPLLLIRIAAYPIQRWILGQSRRDIIGGPDVRVRDLVDSAMAGRWTLAEPQGKNRRD